MFARPFDISAPERKAMLRSRWTAIEKQVGYQCAVVLCHCFELVTGNSSQPAAVPVSDRVFPRSICAFSRWLWFSVWTTSMLVVETPLFSNGRFQ
jgi:hypothetical protein